MSTINQVEANRRNGTLSKGPKTAQGKTVSAKNARKHGLLSADIMLPEEDTRAFNDLADRVHAELGPEGGLEAELTQRIIVLMWRPRRIGKAELGILSWQRLSILELGKIHNNGPTDYDVPADENVPKGEDAPAFDDQPNFDDRPNYRDSSHNIRRAAKESGDEDLVLLGEAFSFGEDSLAKLSRYETSIERSLYRALHELQRLQASRKGNPVPVPIALDVDVTGESELTRAQDQHRLRE